MTTTNHADPLTCPACGAPCNVITDVVVTPEPSMFWRGGTVRRVSCEDSVVCTGCEFAATTRAILHGDVVLH